jgi:hypothetical protein
MHSLRREPEPTYTSRPAHILPALTPASIYVTLAISLTAGSTESASDFMDGVTLQPAAVTSPRNTNTTSLQQQVAAVAPKASWLSSKIDELLAQVPEHAWADVPDISVDDLDARM